MKKGVADKELRKAYEAFGRMMVEEEVYREETLTFDDVCRRIGITGRQLMEAYREGIVPGRINDFL